MLVEQHGVLCLTQLSIRPTELSIRPGRDLSQRAGLSNPEATGACFADLSGWDGFRRVVAATFFEAFRCGKHFDVIIFIVLEGRLDAAEAWWAISMPTNTSRSSNTV
jgi:hypothetical protein